MHIPIPTVPIIAINTVAIVFLDTLPALFFSFIFSYQPFFV
nr:MAG TPA: hypothetical protein [Caudoviricetes sp.]